MNTKLRYIAFVFAITLAVAWCVPSVGQVIKGSISGTVADSQGAVVAGAQVKAKNIETGQVSTTTSDNSGFFRLNLLPVGTYTVSITQTGFKTSENKLVVVNAGSDVGLGSVHLAVGETSTTVEVTAEAPLIETTQSQITATFTGQTLSTFAGIQENEGLDRLALFVPGVVASRSDNFSNANGVGFSSNGLRGRNNDQEIDGQNNNDNSVGGPGLFLSNTEYVGQYVIITNNFGPEYGRNAGSVVNVITKSGTNAWHGSVFGQDRSNFLAALSNTQKNTVKPGSQTVATPLGTSFSGPPRFNEEFSGGAIGGPLVKNKAFIFGGFDSDLFSGQSVYTTSSLSPTPLGLSQLSGCAGIDPTALSVLNKFGPYAFSFGNPSPRPTHTTGGIPDGTFVNQVLTPNSSATPCTFQVGGVTRVLSTPSHGFDFVAKNDLNLGGDTITIRYLFNRANNFNLSDNGAGGWVRNGPGLSQGTLVSWTHPLSSHMVNEARISYGRNNFEFGGGLNPLEPGSGQLRQAFTNITFQAGAGLAIGPATNLPQNRIVNSWQVQDNWNYVRGKHSFKSGINWTYQRSPNIFLPTVNGQFQFRSMAQFLGGCDNSNVTKTSCGNNAAQPALVLGADVPNRLQIAEGQESLDFREYDTFLYGGDDWKISKNLTLNLGLTWTYYGQPANLFNQITAAREADAAKAFWLQSLPLSARTNPAIPSVKNSFGPSVGFAYQPQWGGFITGHGKTTIRGGYRLLYDPPFYNIFVNISSSAPMTFLRSISSTTNANVPTLAANPLLGNPTGPNVRAQLQSLLTHNVFDARTNSETTVSPNFSADRVHSWSFGFEREVTKNSALEVRYVGNSGTNLFQTVDGNPYVGTAAAPGQLQAGLLPAGTPSCAATTQSGPGAGTDVGRLACGFGVQRMRNNGGYSAYHGLQTEFRANNIFKQLTLRTGYTWSKTLDNVSEIFASGTAGNTTFAAQNPFQTNGAEYSNSGLSIPNSFTVLMIEQVPFFKTQKGVVGKILGGWTISADYLLASGQGYTPLQNNAEALAASPFGNVYDTAYVSAFVGTDVARPFFGNINAPLNTVGAFSHDACIATNAGACTTATKNALNLLPAGQLVSINALNSDHIVLVNNSDVRYIMNTATAQTVFGTPFGNVPRNAARDAISNLVNATVYKNFKLGERANFTANLTMNNAFNHFNFSSIVPNLENAGVGTFGLDFANPNVTAANGRAVWIGGKLTF